MKLLGKENTETQIEKFRTNAQPFYATLVCERRLIVPPLVYDQNVFLHQFQVEGEKAYNK